MRLIVCVFLIVISSCISSEFALAQVVLPKGANLPVNRTGTWYGYWGWNECKFTKADMRFFGDGYDFTLRDVEAHQRQRKFSPKEFLNPFTLSVPQFNVRFGYFLRDDLDISIGMDHMKFIVRQNQTVKIDGFISGTGTEHDGEYNNDDKQITNRWLLFEHTDGLNWTNVGLQKYQPLIAWKFIDLRAYEGVSVGILTPRTDATLFNRERHDKYRLAGYALGANAGLNLTLWRYFFVQSELKGGFFHIVSARTTDDKADKARHAAFFGQAVVVAGGRWNFNK